MPISANISKRMDVFMETFLGASEKGMRYQAALLFAHRIVRRPG
jgi:hypothetical protein